MSLDQSVTHVPGPYHVTTQPGVVADGSVRHGLCRAQPAPARPAAKRYVSPKKTIMKKLSSRWTFFYKRIFPAMWFTFLVPAAFVPLLGIKGDWSLAVAPVFASIMALFGYYFFKHTCFDLTDAVFDDGSTLVFRNGAQEARIPLNDIKNVSYSPFINPPRVTLSLRTPTVFGDEITFNAPTRFMPFSPSPIIKELINRIDLARRRTN